MTKKVLTGAIAPRASEKGLAARAEEAWRTCWAGANAVAHPTKARRVAATFIVDMLCGMWYNERIVRRKTCLRCALECSVRTIRVLRRVACRTGERFLQLTQRSIVFQSSELEKTHHESRPTHDMHDPRHDPCSYGARRGRGSELLSDLGSCATLRSHLRRSAHVLSLK
jgi:hypothetical protein